MKAYAMALGMALVAGSAAAQTLSGPPLDYVAVGDGLQLPPGGNFGSPSGIAIDRKGHIFVLGRAPAPLSEFDPDGRFIRAFGEGLFERAHGLRIDPDGNLWTTDVASNLVIKFDPSGRILLVLGVKGATGDWHPYGHLPLFNEPNDVAFGRNGDVFVSQGHGKADSRILKFDRDGNFLKSWGKKGKAPGEFDIPHAMVVDREGLLHVADRNNQRIQVFDQDGGFVRENAYPGTPCGLFLTPDGELWLAHGHAGQVARLDASGKVLGVIGRQGKALGQFGEAHAIAVNDRREVFVADTLNWRVQKFAPRSRQETSGAR